MKSEIHKREWEEFRDAGLLWWVNRIIHLFGWAIVYEFNDNKEVTNVYPARVPYRGFSEKDEKEGFAKVSRFIEVEAATLRSEAES